MPKGRQLSDKHRAYIVQRLACYDWPTEIANDLAQQGVEITRQAVQHYDPTASHTGRTRLAKKWQDLFWECRKAYIRQVEDKVPEANKAVRIKYLAHAAREFKARKNYIGMEKMLESIAKEMGNVHSNKRELAHTGKDGGPIEYADVSDAELDQRLGDMLTALGVSVVNSAEQGDESDGETDGSQVH